MEVITMKVFVTGGSGYIGQATIAALRRGGHEVTALVRGEPAAQAVAGLGATPVTGTLGDPEVLLDAAASADGVIRLASVPGSRAAQVDRDAAAAMQDGAGASPYVHTGGTWIYGNTRGLVTEDAPPAPPPVVAWRLDNEKLVLARAASGGRPIVVMPGIVYGKAAGLIRQFFVDPARDRQLAHYIDDGANHWSLVHVDDIAELYVLALNAPAGSVYAGVTRTDLTMAEVAHAASRAAGCPGRTAPVSLEQARAEMGPIADAFALDQQIDSARARRELGWSPQARDVLAEIALPAQAAARQPRQ
jgi:nucleoside-diphosphate-sugar epimerase